ncbi:AAA-like domain-containing protein (plasmid) [Anabaena sp. FACHB-709]|uniref:vWA-MoxR associated protein N-terminal HTH domain-containing protein n=2 Tax=Nostocaceae TaxID=1162 RepID=A0A1Z4KUN9_ANAVA|nr:MULTISPECIES: AAA-like domain-containing protein [Nostocaceae]BAY72638.1 hypothetical protein NIES23_54660 [Trichormus variabilis NIES-23]MBD2174220.1 AAA-like domain-containing protein [Anabaena cylindrica FACHB-318]MBD2266008.1 AAA-like domain-containing protein [Anabaena sp. FACHB-709]MBD2275459.1 AAA-like domain-containing protein [Nostoc sp. PCC 7120 = FACHB-418]MBD2286284.1 AAA-like domain-containing protein [Anabaena cylindrica FACHB-170]
MSLDAGFQWNAAQQLVDQLMLQTTQKHLSDVEIQVLQGAWEGKTYEAIATESYLTVKYVSEVGGRLWQLLSEALQEEVKKTNFRQALQRRWQTLQPQSYQGIQHQPSRWEFCCAEIDKPGALLRIKAPIQFGKTTLMAQVLKYAQKQGYRAIAINLRDAVADDFDSLDSFLQWFIASVTYALNLTVDMETHWRKSLGNSKIKCRTYLQKYLLTDDIPLVIALDEVDRLFTHQLIAGEFLGMLRTWHEDAKTKLLWTQLRLIVLHTEVYTQIDINQSPFNAGTVIQLTELNSTEILTLLNQYQLHWSQQEMKKLTAIVGGHPYLVTLTLKFLAQNPTSLEQLLNTAATPNSIYRSHLERQWHKLQTHSHLLAPLKAIALADAAISIQPHFHLDDVVKLYDLGLIQLQQHQVSIRYELYRQYFRERLGIQT